MRAAGGVGGDEPTVNSGGVGVNPTSNWDRSRRRRAERRRGQVEELRGGAAVVMGVFSWRGVDGRWRRELETELGPAMAARVWVSEGGVGRGRAVRGSEEVSRGGRPRLIAAAGGAILGFAA